ncbi:AAA family ATPase [Natranaerofaba carboxydovora]|uniref:AAA family ATPase n=1 Tax=Natranaerofaba carboxydovora TaxID=2742683 RepID=UPI001F146D28|nr:MoxR family ATPase [Natranaerofaba carboxydovora]UMZ75052.1 AAA domain (dynein-related subfamily) [Natranaerofaba carboxydovora]
MKISVDELAKGFRKEKYVADKEILTTVYLALKLNKPLLLEGDAGVGKTEISKVLANIFDTELIRLQCYEGLDENKALYEWNYQKQLLKIQLKQDNVSEDVLEDDLFSEEYLLERPLLKAIRSNKAPVLLIDEIDKTDEEFEAFLLEVLSDFTVSVPELGTIQAGEIPIVVLTSNNERELSDGLKRRCIYLYLNYPTVEKEKEIISSKVPGIEEKLTEQVAKALKIIRDDNEIRKKPSIAETLDWTRALVALDASKLDPELVKSTINLLLKTKEDIDHFNENIGADALCANVRE